MKRCIVLLCFAASLAFGQTTYYVRNGGDDSMDGRSDKTAFASLGKIHGLTLMPGDSVLLKRGSKWSGTLNVADYSGSGAKPIVYGAYGSGPLPVIDAGRSQDYGINASYPGLSHVRFEYLEVTGTVGAGVFYNESGSIGLVCDHLFVHHNLNHGITLRRCDSSIVQYCTVHSNGYTPAPGNPQAHGIYMNLCNGGIVRHNLVDSAQGAGIHAYECLNTTICYNTTRECGVAATGIGDGILIWTADAVTVDCYYNYVYNNVGRGISVRDCAAGSTVNLENNTIAGTHGSGLFIYENPGGVTVNVKNNIVCLSTGLDLEIDNTSTAIMLDYNAYYRTSGTMAKFNGAGYGMADSSCLASGTLGAHSIMRDPQFVDVTVSPAIQSSSPCRGAGLSVGLTPDFLGVPVIPRQGRVDIGSSEVASGTATGVAALPAAAPEGYALRQNYPNPFNPTTQIPFALKERGRITLAVYDVLGRRVATLAEGDFAAGAHTVSFSAGQLSSGMYFVRLEAGSFSATRTMQLLK